MSQKVEMKHASKFRNHNDMTAKHSSQQTHKSREFFAKEYSRHLIQPQQNLSACLATLRESFL
jgi:hypothetical protein